MKIISPQDWFRIDHPPALLDVRSPGEFAKGHWPGALSLPLFDNAERAEVGTLYKQESPEVAFLRGLELAGQKLRWYVERAQELAAGKEVAVHCWRGGQRSQSMAWLLSKRFEHVQVISGGYKAIRRAGRDYLAEFSHPLIVLGGTTGSGKTKVLKALRESGETVVDLEQMAHHKGSAFGALGEPMQPTVEQFENDLFHTFLHLDIQTEKPIWLEDESKSIGRVYLPDELWHKMMKAPLIQLDLPEDWRLENLVTDYASYDIEALRASFGRIRKRLGGQNLNAALKALDKRDFTSAASIALRYYDKAYEMSLKKHQRQLVFKLRPTSNEPQLIAKELLEWWIHHQLVGS